MITLALGEYRGPRNISAFAAYCRARLFDRQRDEAFRIYVTDSIRALAKGSYIQTRYCDLFVEHEEIDVESTIKHVSDSLGLEVK